MYETYKKEWSEDNQRIACLLNRSIIYASFKKIVVTVGCPIQMKNVKSKKHHSGKILVHGGGGDSSGLDANSPPPNCWPKAAWGGGGWEWGVGRGFCFLLGGSGTSEQVRSDSSHRPLPQ